MRIVSNSLYWYFGLPVLIYVAFRGLSQYKKNGNMLDQYLGWVGVFFTLYLLTFIMGPIVSTDSTVLTYFFIVASILQYIGLLFLWFAVARLYAPKSRLLRAFIVGFDMLLVIFASYVSIMANLTIPTTISHVSGVFWNINYLPRPIFDILSGVQYASVIIIGAMFLYQSTSTTQRAKRIRTFNLGLILLLVGFVSCFRAYLIGIGDDFYQVLIVGIGVIVLALIIRNVASSKNTTA